MAHVTMGTIDRSNEGSAIRFHLPDVTGANYDTITGNGVGQNVGDLRIATAVLTLNNYTRHTVCTEVYPEAGAIPASPYAQREIKLLVTYVDDVTSKRYTLTIPAPDLTLLAQAGTDVVDLANVTFAAWISVFEANAASPDGNNVTVVTGRIVGRNN